MLTEQQIESGRAVHDANYAKALDGLRTDLRRRLAKVREERAEFNPGAFPPAWKVAKWAAEEEHVRAVSAVVAEVGHYLRFESGNTERLQNIVNFLTEAADGDKETLLASNNYLHHRLKLAEADAKRAWQSVVDTGVREVLWLANITSLAKQFKEATGRNPQLITAPVDAS